MLIVFRFLKFTVARGECTLATDKAHDAIHHSPAPHGHRIQVFPVAIQIATTQAFGRCGDWTDCLEQFEGKPLGKTNPHGINWSVLKVVGPSCHTRQHLAFELTLLGLVRPKPKATTRKCVPPY